ncbi:MAG: hypothetical protein AAFP89_14115 [Bacteroidota bacterium]
MENKKLSTTIIFGVCSVFLTVVSIYLSISLEEIKENKALEIHLTTLEIKGDYEHRIDTISHKLQDAQQMLEWYIVENDQLWNEVIQLREKESKQRLLIERLR